MRHSEQASYGCSRRDHGGVNGDERPSFFADTVGHRVLYSSLRIAPKCWSIFDPVGISILGFLARFGPFRAIPRPDSDSGRSDLRFQHVRPQQIMKYAISMKFQTLEKMEFSKIENMDFLANTQPPKPI